MYVETNHCVLKDLFQYPLRAVRRKVRWAVRLFELLLRLLDIFPAISSDLLRCDIFQ